MYMHAIKSLNKITKQDTKYTLTTTVIMGDLMGGVTGRAAGFRRARRRPDSMADNPPDPH
jgi:hypothetical protein